MYKYPSMRENFMYCTSCKMYKIIIVFLAVATVQIFADEDGDKECNFDVSPLTPTGLGKQYYIVTYFMANWYRAHDFCRYNGMHLLTLQNDADATNLNTLLKTLGWDGYHFWTSGYDLAEYRKFVWGSNGREVGKTLWFAGEPSDNPSKTEHCAEWGRRTDGGVMKLNDEVCSVQLYFICEYVHDAHAH